MVAGLTGTALVALVLAGCSIRNGKQTPLERFADGICPFLAKQPERLIVPPGSLLVEAGDGRRCKDPSSAPDSPYWALGAQYRWTRTKDARGPVIAFFEAALSKRGWHDLRISVLNPQNGSHWRGRRLRASMSREGKTFGIAVTVDPLEGGLYWVGIGTDLARQPAVRATLTR